MAQGAGSAKFPSLPRKYFPLLAITLLGLYWFRCGGMEARFWGWWESCSVCKCCNSGEGDFDWLKGPAAQNFPRYLGNIFRFWPSHSLVFTGFDVVDWKPGFGAGGGVGLAVNFETLEM